MFKVSKLAWGAGAATAGAFALLALAPSTAAAQPYGTVCENNPGNRGVLGALAGGALGAVVGSQVAANHHRTDGSLVGGAVGALGGALVGRQTANCQQVQPPPPPPPPVAYAPPAYYQPAPPPPPRPYAYEQQRFVYGYHGERYRITHRPLDADGCTVAESPVYYPDGDMERKFVRVCLNPAGRFQIVD